MPYAENQSHFYTKINGFCQQKSKFIFLFSKHWLLSYCFVSLEVRTFERMQGFTDIKKDHKELLESIWAISSCLESQTMFPNKQTCLFLVILVILVEGQPMHMNPYSKLIKIDMFSSNLNSICRKHSWVVPSLDWKLPKL